MQSISAVMRRMRYMTRSTNPPIQTSLTGSGNKRSRNRVRPPTQDGRALRRYRRRWIVERTIGWLGNYRRLVVRYDRSLRIYRAFFHIACFMIVLRRVVQ
jgi:Transposase DDE domain